MSKSDLPPSAAPKPTEPTEDNFYLEDVVDLEVAARAALADETRVHGRILPNDPGLQFPDLLAEGETPCQAAHRNTGKQHPHPGVGQAPLPGGLLGQLREQAQSLLEQQEAREHQHVSQAAKLDRSLRQVFAYLHDTVQQLNVLHPEIPRVYPLADNKSLQGLAWQQGYADYRTASLSERAFMETVSLNYCLSGQGAPIVLERDGATAETFRKRLFDFNLNMQVKETRDERKYLKSVRLTIAQEVRVNVRWEPDYQKGELLVHARNLERLGYTTYRLPADAPMNPALLDQFIRMILGQPHRFPHIPHPAS
jgi:hypothetical protein